MKIIRFLKIIKYIYFLIFIISISSFFKLTPNIQDIQFLPSFFKLIINFSIIISIFYLVIILLTLIFGRFYCQFLCPFGIFLDSIPSIHSKKLNSIFKIIDKYKWQIRLFFITIFITGLLFNYNFIISYLEPFSLFSKLYSIIFNNFILFVYEKIQIILRKINILLPAYNYYSDKKLIIINSIILFLIVLFNFFKKRFFCNYICSSGFILNLLSKFPLYKVQISINCIGCKMCENVCPVNCIDIKNKKIYSEECILCFKCIEKCNLKYINYQKSNSLTKSIERKNIIYGFLYIPIVFITKKFNYINKITIVSNSYITPPGSKSIEYLIKNCLSCGLCILQCPSKVINFKKIISNNKIFLIPVLDYTKNYCLYECNKCTEICPFDALTKLSLEKKMRTQLGISKFNKYNCIVYKKETDCGACSEHCPTKAVHMIPYKNNLLIPEVNEEICIGCGACEYVCPTNPKSIIVEPNRIHKLAEKPSKTDNINIDINEKNDFNF